MARKTDSGARPWVRIWLVAVLIAGTSIASVEILARHRGHKPDVPDSLSLWTYHRMRVVGRDPKLIVAIGTSRIRTDISPEVVSESLPGFRLIQLGLHGPVSAVGLLIDLSRIPGFCGTILCDVPAPLFERSRWDDKPAEDRKVQARLRLLNELIECVLREHLVALSDRLSLRRWLGAKSSGRELEWPQYIRVHLNRSMTADLMSDEVIAQIGRAKFREYVGIVQAAKRYRSMNEFRETVAPLADVVATIRRNGGQIVFLRLPTSGKRFELEEAAYPTQQYFPVLADATTAACIDFRSLPGQSDFHCSDDSHLSPEGARSFTRRLLAEMHRRKLLAVPSEPNAD